jgi:hypothetical protein
MSGTAPACPCGTFEFPQPICNLSGLSAISYRVGDFVAFRYQLLEPLPSETELTAWRPGAQGDLGMQMVEWWAYLADILTFYNERIANEAYLDTAALPESVNHLVQLLGYRPKPALGAKGTLAALLSPSARLPLTVPAGLQIQSKPGPGQQPQIFQVDQATTIGTPDLVIADVVPANQPLLDRTNSTFWLAGKVTGIKAGDRLLLSNASAVTSQTVKDYQWINVTGTTPASDPLGNPVAQVAFTAVSGTLVAQPQAAKYVLLRSQQSSPLWGYPNSPPVITDSKIELAGIARGIAAGSLLLLDVADGAASPLTGLVPTAVIATSYAEIVWYANGEGPMATTSSPPNSVPAMAIPHAEIGFTSGIISGAVWQGANSQITVRWQWSEIGQLVPTSRPISSTPRAAPPLSRTRPAPIHFLRKPRRFRR